MSGKLSKSQIITIVLLLYATIIPAIKLLIILPSGPEAQAKNKIAIYENRLKEIQKYFPKDKPVGYLTEGKKINSLYQENLYFIQYAIIPVNLTIYTKPEIYIGDFRSGNPDPGILQNNNLIIDKSLGDGIFLLRRKIK